MGNRFNRFMQGRNGADDFCRFLNIVSFVLFALALVFTILASALNSIVFAILYYVFYGCTLLLMGYCLFRAFSRKVYKRQSENTRYLYQRQRVKRWFAAKKQHMADRKTYRFFRCPRCKQMMRAPKNKGKIRVTCQKCSNVFVTKT